MTRASPPEAATVSSAAGSGRCSRWTEWRIHSGAGAVGHGAGDDLPVHRPRGGPPARPGPAEARERVEAQARRPGSRARASRGGRSGGTRPGSTSPSRGRPPARTPQATASRTQSFTWPSCRSVSGSRSSVQSATRSVPCRSTVGIRAARLRLAEPCLDEDPHALAPLLLRLLEHRALVVGLDPGGQVGVELAAGQPRCVAVDSAVAGGGDLRQQLGVAGDDAGKFITSATPIAPCSSSSSADLGGIELRARALERRGRHAARRADPERERQAGAPPPPAPQRHGPRTRWRSRAGRRRPRWCHAGARPGRTRRPRAWSTRGACGRR